MGTLRIATAGAFPSRPLTGLLRIDIVCPPLSMPNRADDLARLPVLDAEGRSVELGSLWRDRPAVLVFIRHFG